MKDKTAGLDLFHDIEIPQPKEETIFPDMESPQLSGDTLFEDLKLSQLDEETMLEDMETSQEEEPLFEDTETSQEEEEDEPVQKNYLPLNLFPQPMAMMLPVWVFFWPGLPLGVPAMVLCPVIVPPMASPEI